MTKARNTYGTGQCIEIERGKRYRLRVVIGTTESGSPRLKTVTFHGTVTAARDRLADLQAEARRLRGMASVDVEAETRAKSRTVADVLISWLDSGTWKPSTTAEYRRLVALLVAELGPVPVTDLTAETVERLYSSWRADGLSAGTVRRRHAVLSIALARAERLGWLAASPMHRVELRGGSASKADEVPTVEQVARLRTLADNDHPALGLFVALASVTGARRGELVALRWSAVNLDAGTLRISDNLTTADLKAGTVGTPKSRAGRRTVPLDPRTVEMLREHQAWQADEAKRQVVKLAADGYVLSYAHDTGKPAPGSSLTHAFRRICRALSDTTGEPWDFHPHSLRHFAATQLVAAGVDPVTVAAYLGHEDPTTTLRLYSHAVPAKGQDAAAILAALTAPQPALTA